MYGKLWITYLWLRGTIMLKKLWNSRLAYFPFCVCFKICDDIENSKDDVTSGRTPHWEDGVIYIYIFAGLIFDILFRWCN